MLLKSGIPGRVRQTWVFRKWNHAAGNRLQTSFQRIGVDVAVIWDDRGEAGRRAEANQKYLGRQIAPDEAQCLRQHVMTCLDQLLLKPPYLKGAHPSLLKS